MAGIETGKIDELFRRIPKNIGIDPILVDSARAEVNMLKFHAGSQLTSHKQEPWLKSDMQRMEDELQDKNAEIAILKKQIQKLQTSSGMDQMTFEGRNRPNPLTLKQRYSDLYDNEWVKTYQYFQEKGWGEIEIIITLQRILRACHSFCRDVSSEQLQNIKGEALYPTASWMDDGGIMTRTRQEISKAITDLAKQYQLCTARECVAALQKTFIKHVLPTFIDPEKYSVDSVITYVNHCVELTWFMCIQDPPMTLIERIARGTDIDTNVFRKFKSDHGEKYDFMVWPAMLLHKNGPLLVKGVAQVITKRATDINMMKRNAGYAPKRKMEIVPDSDAENSQRYHKEREGDNGDSDHNSWEHVESPNAQQPSSYNNFTDDDQIAQPSSPYFDPYGRKSRQDQVPKIQITDETGMERSLPSSSRYTEVSGDEQRRSQSGHPLTVFWKENPDERIPSAP